MDILNDWYETRLGIRPGDDDASMTVEEMQMLREIVGEVERPVAANDNHKETNR